MTLWVSEGLFWFVRQWLGWLGGPSWCQALFRGSVLLHMAALCGPAGFSGQATGFQEAASDRTNVPGGRKQKLPGLKTP